MNDFIRWKVIAFGLFSSLELCFYSMFSEEKDHSTWGSYIVE